ncbi:MAG: chloride channel protein [Bauldia sp.]
MNDHAGPAVTSPETSALIPDESRTVSLPTLVVLAFVIGIVAALGAVVFRVLIAVVHNAFFLGKFGVVYDANQFDPANGWGLLILLAPIVGGLIVVWLVQTFAPEAKGHGVPEVMYAIYHNNGNVRGAVAIVKSLASAISIGSGASVGREGPIIQIGASFGSTLARLLHLSRWQKITLLSAGAGAGIAATFNTPLGGVMFAVELLLPEVSNRTFLPVVVATTTATSVARLVFGLSPHSSFRKPGAPSPSIPLLFAAFALLGVAAGVASWLFIRVLAWSEDFFPILPGNAYTQNIVGMLLIGLIFLGFQYWTGHAQTAGVGYSTIQSILDGGNYSVVLLIALFAGKLLATTISLGAGASGGVFSPSLFIGATLGGAIGASGLALFPAAGFSVIEFAVVGMGAIVGGATGASMTAIVMISR